MLHESFSHQRLALEASDHEKFANLQKWTIGDLFKHAEKALAEGDSVSSTALYKSWIACNPTNAALHAAYFNYGVALAKGGDRLGAINATRECIRLKPDFYSAYINLGRLLEDAGQAREAVEQWQAVSSKLPQINGESVQHKLVRPASDGARPGKPSARCARRRDDEALHRHLDRPTRGDPALDCAADAAMQMARCRRDGRM